MKTNRDNGVVFRLRSRRLARPGLWLGSFALLLQTLVPFSQALSLTTGNGPNQRTFSLHCLMMADSAPSSMDTDTQLSSSKKNNCPVCQVFAIGKNQSTYVFQPALSPPLFIGWRDIITGLCHVSPQPMPAFYARAPPAFS